MAKNSPAFQCYPADFLGGVMAMSDQACGIYWKLLCSMWIAGGELPYCKESLARCALTSPEAFNRVWHEVEPKFEIASNGDKKVIRNARLTKVKERQEVMATLGSRGGKRAQAKIKRHAPMKSEDRRVKIEDRNPKIEADWEVPAELDCPEVRKSLADFAAMRRQLGKPIRDIRNTSKILKRFSSKRHLLAALDEVIGNEYQGLHPRYGVDRAGKVYAGPVNGHRVDKTLDRNKRIAAKVSEMRAAGASADEIDDMIRRMETMAT